MPTDILNLHAHTILGSTESEHNYHTKAETAQDFTQTPKNKMACNLHAIFKSRIFSDHPAF